MNKRTAIADHERWRNARISRSKRRPIPTDRELHNTLKSVLDSIADVRAELLLCAATTMSVMHLLDRRCTEKTKKGNGQ